MRQQQIEYVHTNFEYDVMLDRYEEVYHHVVGDPPVSYTHLLHDLLLALGRDVQTFHLQFHLSGDLLAGDVHKGSQMGQACLLYTSDVYKRQAQR